MVDIESEEIYEDLAEDVETRFDASKNEVNRPPHIDKKSN